MNIGQAFAGDICPHCQRHISKGHDWNCPGAERHLMREIARADVVELERLRAENQKLRDALQAIDKAAKLNQSTWGHWIREKAQEVLK